MIQIVLKSYSRILLDITVNYLKVSTNITSGIKVIYLPTKIKKITLLRSPHVYKKAKDQYQETIYKVVLEINKSDIVLSKLISTLQNLPKAIFFKLFYK